jgi:hypothetical protein
MNDPAPFKNELNIACAEKQQQKKNGDVHSPSYIL